MTDSKFFMDKILVVYYSRTGTTRKVAEAVRGELGCDIEEIISIKNRSGVVGYFFCGKEATLKKTAEIKPTVENPADYDLVIIGTPVWAWNISSPTRAYLMQNIGKFKKIAVFCTMGGLGDKKAFTEIENICGLKFIASLTVLTKDVGNCDKSIKEFSKKIRETSGLKML